MGLLAALWGASYLFIKVALQDGLAPIFIVFARIALGAVVLVPIAVRWGAWGALRGRWPALACMALVQVVVPFLLITYGELGGRDRSVDDGRGHDRPRARGAVDAAQRAAERGRDRLAARARRGRHRDRVSHLLHVIAEVGPTRASLVAYMAPAFAVLYGVSLLSEPLTAGAALGLVLILGGSWMTAEGRLPGQSRPLPAP